ncbi:MAG: histidine phosphatase family protein [Bradyrhizobium sp.]
MVKAIHLVRHGHHVLLNNRLCGRMPGVGLNEQGCRDMECCAGMLVPAPAAIQCSPQRRARQSAAILARRFGLPVEIVPAVDEIDVGDWTGLAFDELTHRPEWKHWNDARGTARPPNGESMLALQRRVVRHLEQLGADGSNVTFAIVSHAEPIRAALLHYLRVPLDEFASIAIDPASVSTLSVDSLGTRISTLNRRATA